MARGKPTTPLGLPPVFFPIYYTLVLCLTGYAIAAVAALKGLLRDAGVQGHLLPEEQESLLTSITSAGLTISVLGAIVAGGFCDMFGPKLTATLGQAIYIAGYAALFFGPKGCTPLHYTGAVLLGLGYTAIFNSHTCVAALFPRSATLVLSILGCGPDISLFVPELLSIIGRRMGPLVAVSGYLILVAGIMVLEFFLVPWRGFQIEEPEEEVEKDPLVPASESAHAVNQLGGYCGLSLKAQLMTPIFWMFTIFTSFNMFRKFHFTQGVGGIMQDIAAKTGGDARRLIEFHKMAMPFAFVPAILMGVFTNAFGVVAGLALQNLWAVLLFSCCWIVNLPLQYASIIFFNLMSSYIFGIFYAFLAAYYGLATLGTLQGVQLVVVGLVSFGVPFWINDFIKPIIGWRSGSFVLMIGSVLCFAMPFLIHWLCPPLNPVKEDNPREPLLANPDSPFAEGHARLSVAAFAGNAPNQGHDSGDIIRRSVDMRARSASREKTSAAARA